MKHIVLISTLALVGGGGVSADVKLAQYWSFDGASQQNQRVPSSGLANELGNDSSGLWTLYHKTTSESPNENGDMALAYNVNNLTGLDKNPAGYGSSGTYDNYLHLGIDNQNKGSYLTCAGTQLDFSKAWSYSVTSWLKPQSINRGEGISLFSIGDANLGMQLVYHEDRGSLSFEMNGMTYSGNFSSLTGIAPPSSQGWDFRHVGFSMEYNGNGQLVVNYYLNGQMTNAGTITVTDTNTLMNGFTLGAQGKDGGLTQSCNYDDVKIFTGVLDDQEILDAMKKGPGDFEIDVPSSPSVPEPSSALLSCIGFASLLLRRRR